MLKRWFALLCLALIAATALAYGVSQNQRVGDIRIDELPHEARVTLDLIDRGGPFPYRRDGVTFQNRERRLPHKAHDFYREYTVPTPGSQTRGARRIVTGNTPPTVFYYTDDHYRSFARIRREP
jgi:ribonuclease T1